VWRAIAIASLALNALLAISALSRMIRAQRLRFKPLVLLESGTTPTLTLLPGKKWHCFLSHTWSTGQDQAHMIKRELQTLLKGVKVFLDVDDLQEVSMLEHYIAQSSLILFFLSGGYFASRNCLREVKATMIEGNPFILVRETAHIHGGGPLSTFEAAAPESFRVPLFGDNRPAIAWFRQREFRFESLLRIAEAVVLACPGFERITHVPFFAPQAEDLARCKLVLPPDVEKVLMVSPNNPGAKQVAEKLVELIGGLRHQPFEAPKDADNDGGSVFKRRPGGNGSPQACIGDAARMLEAGFTNKIRILRGAGAGLAGGIAHGMGGVGGRRSSTFAPPPSLPTSPPEPEGTAVDVESGLPPVLADAPVAASADMPASSSADAAASAPAEEPSLAPAEELSPAPAEELSPAAAEEPSPAAAEEPPADPTPPKPKSRRKLSKFFGTVMESGRHYMLLVCNKYTFVGEEGKRLANDVRWALKQNSECILVHELRDDIDVGACEFSDFFVNVPEDLALNLFQNKIAIPLLSKPFLAISAASVSKALGVQPEVLSRQELLRQLYLRTVTRADSNISRDDAAAENSACDDPTAEARRLQLIKSGSCADVMGSGSSKNLNDRKTKPRGSINSLQAQRAQKLVTWARRKSLGDGSSRSVDSCRGGTAEETHEVEQDDNMIEQGMPRSWVLLPWGPGGILRRGNSVTVPKKGAGVCSRSSSRRNDSISGGHAQRTGRQSAVRTLDSNRNSLKCCLAPGQSLLSVGAPSPPNAH